MLDFANSIDKDKTIQVKADCGDKPSKNLLLESSIYRELAFVVEHTGHHMAIFRPILVEEKITLPENFGLTASTKKFRNTCIH